MKPTSFPPPAVQEFFARLWLRQGVRFFAHCCTYALDTFFLFVAGWRRLHDGQRVLWLRQDLLLPRDQAVRQTRLEMRLKD